MNIKTFTLLLLSFLPFGLSQGAKKDVKVPEIAKPLESKAANDAEALNAVEETVIESPIVSKEDKHGQLFRYAYDAEHLLFPVKIISIDGWLVTDFVTVELDSEQPGLENPTTIESKVLEILLAPGEHQMKVVPDFANIEPQTVFMSFAWQEKQITFKLTEGQQVAVAARLLNVETMQWALQLYRVEIPLEDESEDTTANPQLIEG